MPNTLLHNKVRHFCCTHLSLLLYSPGFDDKYLRIRHNLAQFVGGCLYDAQASVALGVEIDLGDEVEIKHMRDKLKHLHIYPLALEDGVGVGAAAMDGFRKIFDREVLLCHLLPYQRADVKIFHKPYLIACPWAINCSDRGT